MHECFYRHKNASFLFWYYFGVFIHQNGSVFVFFLSFVQCSVFQKWKDFEGWSSQVNVNSLSDSDFLWLHLHILFLLLVHHCRCTICLLFPRKKAVMLNACWISAEFLVISSCSLCRPITITQSSPFPAIKARSFSVLPDTLPWFGQLFSTLTRLLFHAGPPAHLHIFHCACSHNWNWCWLILLLLCISLNFLSLSLLFWIWFLRPGSAFCHWHWHWCRPNLHCLSPLLFWLLCVCLAFCSSSFRASFLSGPATNWLQVWQSPIASSLVLAFFLLSASARLHLLHLKVHLSTCSPFVFLFLSLSLTIGALSFLTTSCCCKCVCVPLVLLLSIQFAVPVYCTLTSAFSSLSISPLTLTLFVCFTLLFFSLFTPFSP